MNIKTRVHRPGRLVALAAAASLTLALASCSDDDGDEASSPDEEVATQDAGAEEETASEVDAPETIQVVATDYAFAGLPASVPAGTQLTLVNEADAELHELVAFRIPDDEERSGEELVALGEGLMPAMGGPPVAVLLALPGGEQIAAVGDGTLEEPGRYLLVCVIPTEADPDEYLAAAADSDGPPDVAGGPPHVVHGMWAELEVD